MRQKRITKDQLQSIYRDHLSRDFITAELKSRSFFEDDFDRGVYFGDLFYDQDRLIAYTFYGKRPGGNYLLLDYLAVLPEERSKGYGAEILAALKKEAAAYDGVIVEAEAIDAAKDEQEQTIRRRRIAFYRQNGLKELKLRAEVNGVTFTLLLLTDKEKPAEEKIIKEELAAIYHTLYEHTEFKNAWRLF
ncbi:MAG TPA: GNAT family N-acetyltransferase [Clostridiales bacterium]|nr:GNAT family N-acetyltransferase [Clostridiales bacterium]